VGLLAGVPQPEQSPVPLRIDRSALGALFGGHPGCAAPTRTGRAIRPVDHRFAGSRLPKVAESDPATARKRTVESPVPLEDSLVFGTRPSILCQAMSNESEGLSRERSPRAVWLWSRATDSATRSRRNPDGTCGPMYRIHCRRTKRHQHRPTGVVHNSTTQLRCRSLGSHRLVPIGKTFGCEDEPIARHLGFKPARHVREPKHREGRRSSQVSSSWSLCAPCRVHPVSPSFYVYS
jgi:hypothetical protein